MSSSLVVLPPSVGGTVELSCESAADIVPDVEDMRAQEMKIQEGLKRLCILLRWVLRLDRKEDEGAVSDRFCDGGT